MKKMLPVFCIILLFNLPLFSQEVDTAWVRRYSGPGQSHDVAHGLCIDREGNLFVTGSTVTVKYTSNGDQLWVGQFGGNDLAIDESDNVYVTGSGGTTRYDASGNLLWTRPWSSSTAKKPVDYWMPQAIALALDNSGNICVTGMFHTGSSLECVTIKYYPDGDTAWVTQTNAGNQVNGGFDIAVDASENLYVTGVTGHTNGYDRLTIKYYPNGDTAWVRTYIPDIGPGTPYAMWGVAVTVDDSGNVYTTGLGVTLKYDASGNLQWADKLNGYDIALNSSGTIYLTGMSDSLDYLTAKCYPNGDTAWTKIYDGPGNDWDQANSIALDSLGNVYVTGGSTGSTTGYDYATMKYDPSGNRLWLVRFDGPAHNEDFATDIAIDAQGNVYVTGSSLDITGDENYVTIKYLPSPFLRGDVNGDAKLTVTDVVYLINYLFKGGPKPDPLKSGDANCDSKVTISDVVFLVNYLFKGGPSPSC
jgi:hypothetical protein